MVLKLIGGLVVATLIAVGLYQVLTYLLADREPAPTPNNPRPRSRLDLDDTVDVERAAIKRWAIIAISIVAFLAALSVFFSAW